MDIKKIARLFIFSCLVFVPLACYVEENMQDYPAQRIISSGPIAWWKLDDVEGSTALDSSGHKNHGTVHGAAWSGKSLHFDGVDDYVDIGKYSDVINSFTVEMWINPLIKHEIDTESTANLFGTNGRQLGTSGQKYALFPSHGDTVWGAKHAGAGISAGINGISVYEHADCYMPALLVWPGTLTGWTHIAVVYENKQPRLYVNGAPVRTGLTSTKMYVHPSMERFGDGFKGFISNVKIYGYARSPAEIQAEDN